MSVVALLKVRDEKDCGKTRNPGNVLMDEHSLVTIKSVKYGDSVPYVDRQSRKIIIS